jgi:hypothetical protein
MSLQHLFSSSEQYEKLSIKSEVGLVSWTKILQKDLVKTVMMFINSACFVPLFFSSFLDSKVCRWEEVSKSEHSSQISCWVSVRSNDFQFRSIIPSLLTLNIRLNRCSLTIDGFKVGNWIKKCRITSRVSVADRRRSLLKISEDDVDDDLFSFS